MEDVAKAAAVSTATVSRVLNSPELVAPETAARVQRAIQDLGYRPNVFAQGLMTRKSRLLGIALPDIHGEFYSELLRGADAEARRQGYHLLISSEARDDESGLIGSAAGFVAGVAVMLTEPNEALWKQIREASEPFVVIDSDIGAAGVDRVLVDNAIGTRDAVDHLLGSVKPERCYFVGGPRENFDTEQRARVFADTLSERGHRPDERHVRFGDYSVDWGHRCGGEILAAANGEPIGVLAGNDEIAFGVMLAAADRGLNVPGKVRIIGFDDTRLATLLRPGLTTVRVPMAQVGAAAIAALIARIDEPGRPASCTRLPTELVVRGTSAPAKP
ncbi:MAG: LacI family DNA-binding transcriptional regulator [Phycisphaerales bacterium]|nr:LacI family DNA-binding transcriptional regulator [Phycisphaerales bacterium]